MGRLNRSVPADEAQRFSKSEMLVTVTSLSAELGSKRVARASTLDGSLLDVGQDELLSEESSEDEPVADEGNASQCRCCSEI